MFANAFLLLLSAVLERQMFSYFVQRSALDCFVDNKQFIEIDLQNDDLEVIFCFDELQGRL